jgi:hypothetical protein
MGLPSPLRLPTPAGALGTGAAVSAPLPPLAGGWGEEAATVWPGLCWLEQAHEMLAASSPEHCLDVRHCILQ